MLLLAVSLFFTHPSPLDMPKAEAYCVSDDERQWLEDRYDEVDLWTSRAVLGRWEDGDGRCFTVSRLDVVPPKFTGEPVTREKYTANEAHIDPKKDLEIRDAAVNMLSPVEPSAEPKPPRQRFRGFKEILYYEGTNETAVVCAFLREKGSAWYLATWELANGDDHDWAREIFEEEILSKWDDVVAENLRSEIDRAQDSQSSSSKKIENFADLVDFVRGKKSAKTAKTSQTSRASQASQTSSIERQLLRLDARHSVTNYTDWHVTEAEEFSVLDALPSSIGFISSLTNDMTRMRRRYAEVMPSPIDGSNVLCVARIYSNRDDYLAAAGEDMAWSAAYWNPLRRELVAYLPEGGADELTRTIRHEAFHQYLSYASSMISASPWLNEGYAQYFEDEDSTDWKLGEVGSERIEQFADLIPAILGYDYQQFYAGDGVMRQINYRIAWSIAVFLEKGAPKIRFEPFADLKRDYIAALIKTLDMRKATAAAFYSKERIDLFIREWKKFWKNM